MLDAQWIPVVKSGQSALRTDRFNMLYREASNLFRLAVELIDLGRRRDSSKFVLPNIKPVTFDFGISVDSHRLSC